MWLILIACTFHFTRHGIIFPFIPLLAEKMGASSTMIGFIVGAFSLIAVFLSIPLGGLVDRFGVKQLLISGVICNIINAAILIQTDTVTMLIIAQLIAGIAFLLHVVASQAYISRLSDASQREKGFGWLSFGAAAGQSVGPILGGILVSRFDYRSAFWVALAMSVAGLISIFGLGFGMTQPLSMVMVADLADPNRSGLTMGLRFTAIMLAGLLSPIFLGLIIESFGMRPAFYVAAAVVTLTGIRMFIIRPDLIPGRRL